MRYDVLTAVTVRNAVFWDMTLCSIIEMCTNILKGSQSLHHQPNGEGSSKLWNVSTYLPEYVVSHCRRQQSSNVLSTKQLFHSPPYQHLSQDNVL